MHNGGHGGVAREGVKWGSRFTTLEDHQQSANRHVRAGKPRPMRIALLHRPISILFVKVVLKSCLRFIASLFLCFD